RGLLAAGLAGPGSKAQFSLLRATPPPLPPGSPGHFRPSARWRLRTQPTSCKPRAAGPGKPPGRLLSPPDPPPPAFRGTGCELDDFVPPLRSPVLTRKLGVLL